MKTRVPRIFLPVLLTICFVGQAIYATAQDDSSVGIEFSAFTMNLDDIRSMLKGGIDRSEMNQLQKEVFKSRSLLKDDEPITLKEDTSVTLESESLQAVKENPSGKAFMLLFEVMKPKGVQGSIDIYNYGLNAKDEKVLERKAKWSLSEKSNSYRYVDFRFAELLQMPTIVYELTLSSEGITKTHKITISTTP